MHEQGVMLSGLVSICMYVYVYVYLKDIREARQTGGIEEAIIEKHNDPELPGETKSAMNDTHEINANPNAKSMTSLYKSECNAQC